MIFDFLNPATLIASAVCFVIGSFGYILFKFWFSPMMRYRNTKKQIHKALAEFGLDGESPAQCRQFADTLSSVYHDALPRWYQMLLEKREEDPLHAASLLMKLSNTRDHAHASRQMEQILASLNIKE